MSAFNIWSRHGYFSTKFVIFLCVVNCFTDELIDSAAMTLNCRESLIFLIAMLVMTNVFQSLWSGLVLHYLVDGTIIYPGMVGMAWVVSRPGGFNIVDLFVSISEPSTAALSGFAATVFAGWC